MNDEETESSRPLNMLLDVREGVQIAATRYQREHHGLTNNGRENLLREWHVRVMAYRRQIGLYSSNQNISDEWKEEIGEVGDSLAELGDRQLQKEVTFETTFDPDEQRVKQVRSEEAEYLTPTELVAVTEQLDQCATALGFGAPAESGDGDIFAIKRDPEDYDEPVNDDIPKPQ